MHEVCEEFPVLRPRGDELNLQPFSYHRRSSTMTDLYENPMGLMGFEFIEFASPTPGILEPVF